MITRPLRLKSSVFYSSLVEVRGQYHAAHVKLQRKTNDERKRKCDRQRMMNEVGQDHLIVQLMIVFIERVFLRPAVILCCGARIKQFV